MHNHLIPFLVVFALPALYLGYRLGWLAGRRARLAAAVLVAAGALWSFPWHGLDLAGVKRVNLLLALAAALVLLLRHLRVPWASNRRRRLTVLAALAALAVLNYCNYFAFHGHGTRAFIHLHDVAHYYLGSKYYAELGYTDLYTAMLRAEAELYDDHFRTIEARDLETYEQVHIRVLLRRSDPVKARFTPERWNDFRRDVAFFRERLEPEQYARVLLDHGFNPTPVWALLGGTLANRVPPGAHRGILALTLLDPLLLIGLFAAVARVFGLEAMLLAVLHFCVVFGGTFGWTGGAFLRYPWFFALVVALCCLHRRRPVPAGALLALAAMLRVFPAVFLVPLVFKAAAIVRRRKTLPRRYGALFGSFGAAAAILFALTALLPDRGDRQPFAPWLDFRANMANHLENISPNVVGLTEALAFRRGARDVTAGEFQRLKDRRQRIYRLQLAAVFLPVLLATAWLAGRRTDLGAALLALPLLYAGLSLAAYYYVFLVLAVLVHRRSPRDLALIFAVEAAPYVLMLFEDRDAVLFVYRGLLLAFLYLALELGRRRTALRRPACLPAGDEAR